jgi:hypothetical protein
MENSNLKNDFTGTWICRNGYESMEIVVGDGSIVRYGPNGNAIDLSGKFLSDWDLMERISEKDHRR